MVISFMLFYAPFSSMPHSQNQIPQGAQWNNFITLLVIKSVKILEELVESKPKVYPKPVLKPVCVFYNMKKRGVNFNIYFSFSYLDNL